MSLQVTLSGPYQTSVTTLTTIAPLSTGSSIKSDGCNIYVSAEPQLHHEKEQTTACLTRSNMHFQEIDPNTASHFLLFITDSFLKSKDRLLPLIHQLKHDPHFKQRLFAIVMDEGIKKHIYPAGGEELYVQYWTDDLKTISPQSSQYGEVQMIRDNISIFIQTLRVTLMPNSLDELIKDDMAMVTDVIKKRTHLLKEKQFFSLPLSSANVFSGREAAIDKLSSVLKRKTVARIAGEKGIGKTTLAVEYAKRSEVYPTGIFWLDASNQQTLDRSFQNLGVQLKTSPDHAKTELPQMKDFLLIYDNVTDPTLIPQINAGHTIIIGSNLKNPDMVLERFSAEEAECFVLQQIKATSEEACELCDLLEYHPTNLTEAINYMKRIKISISDYLNAGRAIPRKERQHAPVRASSAMTADLNIVEPSQQHLNTYRTKSVDALFQDLRDQDIQIFVSYNWGATAEVNKIDKVFGDNGIQLIRDTREARPFESLRKFMKKVIRVSDYTFSMVSVPYIKKSFNCLYEVIITMKDPNWKSRVFPIIIPGTILDDASIQSCKQYWLDEADRIEKVGGSSLEVAIAREGADQIVTYLEFVKQVSQTELDVQLNSKFQDAILHMLARQEKLEKKGLYKQDIFHLPMGRNQLFTGREKEMRQLENTLNQAKFSAITNTGMGGVGKTQLALEYAYKHEKEYKMIYWIRSENMDTLKSDLRMLGSDMEISEEFLKDDKLIVTMKAELEKRDGWLLVFDNAKSAEELAMVMPQKGGHVIVTSRDPNWRQTLKIDVYCPEEALSYLQKISGVTGQDEQLRQLAKDLGYLPLALTQAGAYIRRQQIDVASYREEYKGRQKELLSQKEKGYPDSVATTWLISMEKIQQEDPNATRLLNFCSYLAPDNIPTKILEAWLDKKNGEKIGLGFHDALAVLESYSMIDQNVVIDGTYKKSISIHRLIQAVTRDECEEKDAKKTVLLGVAVLSPEFDGKISTKADSEAAEALATHATALVSHIEEKGLTLTFNSIGYLINDLAEYFLAKDFQKAEEYFQKALTVFITCNGEVHKTVSNGYSKLGRIAMIKNDINRAKECLINSLNINLALNQTEEHPDIAIDYIGIGNLLSRIGDFNNAKEYYENALKILIQCSGTENIGEVAGVYYNLADVLINEQKFSEALEYCKRALNIEIACFKSENHTDVADSYIQLADVYWHLGNFKSSKENYEKALRIKKECYGTENHHGLTTIYNNLGNVLRESDDFDSAIKYYEKALEIDVAYYGTKCHSDVSSSLYNIGITLQEVGDYESAKEKIDEALRIDVSYRGTENHPDVASIYNSLGNLLFKMSNWKDAKASYEKALKIRLDYYGTENRSEIAGIYINLGNLQMGVPDLNGANEYFEKALQIQLKIYGKEDHPEVALTYSNLANVLREKGDLEKAKIYFEKALKIEIVHYGDENHISIAKTYNNLGLLLTRQQDFKGAKESFQKALQIEITCYQTENHPSVALSYNNLGNNLRIEGNYTSAKEHFEKSLKIYADFFGNQDHIEMAKGYYNIGLVLLHEGNYSLAREYFERSLKIKITHYGTENNPHVADSHAKIGDAYFCFKQKEQARTHFLKAKELYQQTDGEKYNAFLDGKIRQCEASVESSSDHTKNRRMQNNANQDAQEKCSII